jgi:hypothetical protein
VEEINAMRHQSTEKLARNLEQLLSGPKVGAETRSAPTPAGAGTGAGGGGGGGTGGVGVESDQSRSGEGDGSDSSSASLSEQEGKSSEQDAVPVPIPSNVFSFARITQVRHSCVLISVRHIYSLVITSHHISSNSITSPSFIFLSQLLFLLDSIHTSIPLFLILFSTTPFSSSLMMHQIGKGESYPTLGSMKPKKTPPVTATSNVEVKAKASVELPWGRGLTPAPAIAAVGTGGSSKQTASVQGQGQTNKKGTPLLSNSR